SVFVTSSSLLTPLTLCTPLYFPFYLFFFFFNDTAPTEIYTLSLHDALPISAGQYFTNDQIKEMTRKVSAEVDLVHQQTQNQRYGSSHIGATAKDISNVVTDAASGVVDIFHGIDKAVADTWNNFWKDGKA